MKKVLAMILSTVMILTMAVFAAPSPAAAATVSSYDVTVYFTGSEGLALKYTPDENAGKYFNIPEGTSLHIDNVSSGWGQTSYNGCTGWVSLRYTRITGDYPTPQPSSGYISPVYYTVYNTEGEGLELRTSPTTSSSTFGPMYDGTVIKAEAVSGEWVYGSWNGHYGWCHTAYLRGSYASEIETYEARVRQQAQTNVQPVISAGGGYAQAYIDILFAWEGEIEQYDWQHTDSASMPVVLCDITNDGIPELIFICAVQDEYALIPQLRIYTYENEEARELFADTWGHQKWAGGYSFYYLFLMTGKPSLYY